MDSWKAGFIFFGKAMDIPGTRVNLKRNILEVGPGFPEGQEVNNPAKSSDLVENINTFLTF